MNAFPLHKTLLLLLALTIPTFGKSTTASTIDIPTGGTAQRCYCVQTLIRIADPVLQNLSQAKLKQTMPVIPKNRSDYSHLEALGRLLSGMAPWLELGPDNTEEGHLRTKYIQLAVQSIANAVDPKSPDYMNFTHGGQPLVDAAFLAQALLRAPKQLWANLPPPQQTNLVNAFKATRIIKPGQNNWLLFSATVEAALWQFTGDCQQKPIEEAITKHMQWYKGDGIYGDGAQFHWDYYNSYVIQPMLLDVLLVCQKHNSPIAQHYSTVLQRARRYATVQERLISPEGTFPILGRSSAYRFGAFQLLGQIALMHQLPTGTEPAAVRCALTTVIHNMIEAPGTFDQNGWLQIGAVGYQPNIGEAYISTGSLYLCAMGLVQLGLPPTDPFWTAPDHPWTQKKIWSGKNTPADHAIPN